MSPFANWQTTIPALVAAGVAFINVIHPGTVSQETQTTLDGLLLGLVGFLAKDATK